MTKQKTTICQDKEWQVPSQVPPPAHRSKLHPKFTDSNSKRQPKTENTFKKINNYGGLKVKFSLYN